jgi:Ni,Fe-hydrogenase maturation factor
MFEALTAASLKGGTPPKTIFIGIEPKDIGLGIGMSPEIERKLPEIIRVITDEINDGPEETERVSVS